MMFKGPVSKGKKPPTKEELARQIDEADKEYSNLRRSGQVAEGLQVLERGMFLRRDKDGAGTQEVEQAAQTLSVECNMVSMASLQAGDLVYSYELLKKAEILTDQQHGLIKNEKQRLRLRAITFNNFGCFFRKRGKLHSALQALDKALRIELMSDNVDNPATTHLNMCAVLSQLQKHRAALQHALCAVDLLKNAVDPRSILGLVGRKEGRDPSLVAVACHNAATEYEHLGQQEEAVEMYEKASQAAGNYWGAQHEKTRAITKSYEKAKRALNDGGKKKAKPNLESERSDRSIRAQHSKIYLSEEAEEEIQNSLPSLTGGAEKRKKARKKGLKELMLEDSLPAINPASPSPQKRGAKAPTTIAEDSEVASPSLSPIKLPKIDQGGAIDIHNSSIDSLREMLQGTDQDQLQEKIDEIDKKVTAFINLIEEGDLEIESAGSALQTLGIKIKKPQLRVKMTGYAFAKQLIIVDKDTNLENLRAKLEENTPSLGSLSAGMSYWIRYIDEDQEFIQIDDDISLRSAIKDCTLRADKTLTIDILTSLDKEREEMEEAARQAEKERLEMEEAERAAQKELEEAEEAERQAEIARQQAAAADAAHSKEEEEAIRAEQLAEEARIQRDKAEEALGRLKKQLAAEQQNLEELIGDGKSESDPKVVAIKQKIADLSSQATQQEDTHAAALAEHEAAVQDAERERAEAEAAKAQAKKERAAAVEAERQAAKERAEAEAAQRTAEKERAEFEQAQRVADKEAREFHQLHEQVQEDEASRTQSDEQVAEEEMKVESLSEDAAVTRIACAFKMNRARKDMKIKRQLFEANRRKWGARQIQRMYRGMRSRKRAKHMQRALQDGRKNVASNELQRCIRGFLHREKFHQVQLKFARQGMLVGRYFLSQHANQELLPNPGAVGRPKVAQEKENILHFTKHIINESLVHFGVDMKREDGHCFRAVKIRFERSKEVHVREVKCYAALTETGQYEPRHAGLKDFDLKFVSLCLDTVMSIPVWQEDPVNFVVLPQPSQSMDQYFKDKMGLKISDEVLSVFIQVVRALEFLHTRGYVHCNLSASSFGLVRGTWVIEDLSQNHQIGEPLIWKTRPEICQLLAPEVIELVKGIEDEVLAHPSLDIFLLGLMMYEILIGHKFFRDYSDAVEKALREGDFAVGTGRCKDALGKYILENTICKHPTDRFTTKDLLMNLIQIGNPYTTA